MLKERLDTPEGFIQITINGNPVPFEVNIGGYDTYSIGDLDVQPEGCYDLFINISNCHKGDVVVVEHSTGQFEYDGGGERIENIIGELENYIIGLGCPATDDYEDDLKYMEGDVPDCLKDTNRVLPYELWGNTGKGFEFRIVDDPQKYNGQYEWRITISTSVVWEQKDKEYAWDIVSFLTS